MVTPKFYRVEKHNLPAGKGREKKYDTIKIQSTVHYLAINYLPLTHAEDTSLSKKTA